MVFHDPWLCCFAIGLSSLSKDKNSYGSPCFCYTQFGGALKATTETKTSSHIPNAFKSRPSFHWFHQVHVYSELELHNFDGWKNIPKRNPKVNQSHGREKTNQKTTRFSSAAPIMGSSTSKKSKVQWPVPNSGGSWRSGFCNRNHLSRCPTPQSPHFLGLNDALFFFSKQPEFFHLLKLLNSWAIKKPGFLNLKKTESPLPCAPG